MILEIDNIELGYKGRKILYGIYLQAETGKITGVLGRNGCGKSSLLKILFGNLAAKYSTIRIDGIHQKKKLFKTGKIAYLPQHKLLPNSLRLKDAFSMFEMNWELFVAEFPTFHNYKLTKVNVLSSGERRLVETYLILCSEKEIILLDEPFSSIAPLYIDKLKTILNKQRHKSAFVITDHYYEDILDLSDTVYFIKDGYSKMINTKADLEDEGYLLSRLQK